MRILIAEDDSNVASGLTQALRQSGYSVDWVNTGLGADAALSTTQFDLLILDLGLPKLSGADVLTRLRRRASDVPVLILSALGGVNDRVRGLDLGADDYLAKPFALEELKARVRALTRRASGSPQTTLKHGALTLDTAGRVAEFRGQTLDLSTRELALLETLLQRTGRMVSKDNLVDHLCQWGDEVSTNAIEVYVHRLRKKLEPAGIRIVTVRGMGYCLEKPRS